MKNSTQFDNLIIDSLTIKAENIQPSDNLINNIHDDIQRKQAINTMDKTLKKTSIRKIAVICALCVTLVSGVAYAASQATNFISHSNHVYDKLPALEQLKTDVGFAPKYVDEFTNGYVFLDGSIGNTDGLDDDGNKVASQKFVSLSYAPDGAADNMAILDVSPFTAGIDTEVDPNAETITVYNIKLNYYQQHYKFVPVDYQLTAADNKAVEEGSLVISFGSAEVEESNIETLSWVDSGLAYSITDLDSNLTKAELVQMAKEIIAQK